MYYPVFLEVKGKKCVVVGGGQVALRKVHNLLECGAKVAVISPDFCEELKNLADRDDLTLVQRNYQTGDLKGARIAFGATNDQLINHQVAEEGKLTGILINVVDDASESDFIVPSCFSRGDVTVAVSTAGKSPALARKIRSVLEKDFGNKFADLAIMVNEVRSELKSQGQRFDGERWQEALDIDALLNLINGGHKDEARKLLLDGLFSLNFPLGGSK